MNKRNHDTMLKLSRNADSFLWKDMMLRQALVEISDAHLGSHVLKTWSIGVGTCDLRLLDIYDTKTKTTGP